MTAIVSINPPYIDPDFHRKEVKGLKDIWCFPLTDWLARQKDGAQFMKAIAFP